MWRFLALILAAGACGDNQRADITIVAGGELALSIGELAALTPYPISVVEQTPADRGGLVIRVVLDRSLPAQSYQLSSPDPNTLDVAGADLLGAQYGASAALETVGFRFRHPFDTFTPQRPTIGDFDDGVQRPDVRVRGFHFHTLHPIESYFALWEPGVAARANAHRVIDWLIKNRGNYIQWAALDDILASERYAPWKEYTRELIDYAHARGVRIGINLQLFGASNLQQAFDLVDDETAPVAPQIAQRLPLLTDGLPFDVYDLSFGEFFNLEPQAFVDAVDEVHRQLAALAPAAEMHALIHVGANQRVTFRGEDLIYYFLVKFADPAIVPDVHSVMFYNLFEPTGGAYHHQDFSEHRAYLLDRMCRGQPHAYHPETAYWVAFDNSVPQLLPLYVHNRWLDLDQIAKQGCGKLDNQLLFSSGWEWGYWLHDVTAMRASWRLPASPREAIAAELAGDLGEAVDPVVDLIEVQRRALMLGNLIAYIAGRDAAIDAGRKLGIVSQPDRVTFADLAGGADRAAFERDVLIPLERYRDEITAIANDLADRRLPDTVWAHELVDGLAIDVVRADFMATLYRATLAKLAGDEGEAELRLITAGQLFGLAQSIVAARHSELHDPDIRYLDKTTNRTFYQFGYLFMADTLCYWEREISEVRDLVRGTSGSAPACLF